MSYSKQADLITIGQWIESKICFGSIEEPFTSNTKYEEVGEKFLRYVIMMNQIRMFLPTGNLSDYDVHMTMKELVSYRLTPYAIAFAHKYQEKLDLPFKDKDAIKDNHFTKSVMYLSDKALCNFHITIQPSYNLMNVCMHARDYFEMYPSEKFVVEIDGLESVGEGKGKELLEDAMYALSDVPVLLQAEFLHYGDYECEEGMERIDKLVKFYESLGFENVNNCIGDYEESVMMLANKDKIMEENREM